MQTYSYDFKLRKGETFSRDITLTDEKGEVISLSGKLAKGQIRTDNNAKTLIAEFETVVSGGQGKVTISLTHNQTKDVQAGQYRYDVAIYNSLEVDYFLEGNFIFVEPSTEITIEEMTTVGGINNGSGGSSGSGGVDLDNGDYSGIDLNVPDYDENTGEGGGE